MSLLEEVREIFKQDAFATEAAGIVIDSVEKGHAICSMTLDHRHMNAVDSVMGGAIFTLADFAFAVAANVGSCNTVSQTSQITFLAKTKGTRLIAEAKCVKPGGNICFFIVNVRDDLDQEIAMVTITGSKVNH